MEIYTPKKFGYGFAKHIREYIIQLVKDNYNAKKTIDINVALIDEYNLPQDILISEIFKYMFKYIEIVSQRDYYLIRVNPNVSMEGTNVKLVTLIKYITFGSLHHRGYPLLKEVLKQVREEIEEVDSGD